jgi:DNA-binding beta-propeller fold protein YncE
MTESLKNPFLGLGMMSSFTSFSREKVVSGIDCETLPAGRYIEFSGRKQLDVSSKETYPTGVFVGDSGNKLYTVGQSGDGLDQWALSTPWDPSTGTWEYFYSTVGTDFSAGDTFFSSDGTKFYFVGDVWDKVYEFHMSTAWNISTASYDSDFSLGTANNVKYPVGLTFSPDGVYMFVYATQTKNLSRWTLSTPWDISTAGSKSTSSFSSGKVDTYASAGIAFAADGKRLVIATSGGPGDKLIEYSLGTAWTVTTTSFISEIGFSAHQNYATGCCWGNNGQYLYVCGSNPDTVDRYETCSAGHYKLFGRP